MTSIRLVLALLAGGLLAAGPGALVAQDPPPCADEKSHQFDFWIGDWEVFAGEDLAGRNSIQPILDGCVLQESWRGSRGSAGSSLNFYNPQKGKWQQFWVWRNGTTLELEGELENGNMLLSGTTVDKEGKETLHRVTWYDNPDGTVRQWWETSSDGGDTWETAFDGHYRQKE